MLRDDGLSREPNAFPRSFAMRRGLAMRGEAMNHLLRYAHLGKMVVTV